MIVHRDLLQMMPAKPGWYAFLVDDGPTPEFFGYMVEGWASIRYLVDIEHKGIEEGDLDILPLCIGEEGSLDVETVQMSNFVACRYVRAFFDKGLDYVSPQDVRNENDLYDILVNTHKGS